MSTVRDFSLSSRVIALAESVDGFSVVALTVTSKLLSADGNEIALRDMQRVCGYRHPACRANPERCWRARCTSFLEPAARSSSFAATSAIRWNS